MSKQDTRCQKARARRAAREAVNAEIKRIGEAELIARELIVEAGVDPSTMDLGSANYRNLVDVVRRFLVT
jgi:hypothetical protein